MKVLTAFSDNFLPLYNRWSKTLPKCFEADAKLIVIPQDDFGYASQSWYDAIKLKIEHFKNVLESSNDGEIIICCDCDIFFTRSNDSLKNYIQSQIEQKNLDFLFMREAKTSHVNGGFYVVKNSALVRSILQKAIEHCDKKTPYADQDYFNGEDFQKSGIKWDYIDYKLVAWGNLVFDRRNTLFHHAVCTRDLQEKLKQQEKIARLFRLTLPK